eukprot:gene19272-19675_t
MPPIRALEFYSGIGGMHFALKAAGIDATVLAAFDINTNANDVYKHNFPGVKVVQKLIESTPVETFHAYDADLWTMSPPCQPFTRQGNQHGSDDSRSKSFLFLMKLLRDMPNPPRYLLMENVKGFEEATTQLEFITTLQNRGYRMQEFLLSPEQIGMPNSRLRYYMIATLKDFKATPTGTVLE